MTDITLYRYIRDDGGVTVSTEKPKTDDYSTLHRLIADERMILSNGIIDTYCIDTEYTDEWTEAKSLLAEEGDTDDNDNSVID